MEVAERKRLTFRQIAVEKKNLIQVCRLAVKTIIDRSCLTSIDGDSDELVNFCAIIEQILSHRIRPIKTWLGTEEPRPFWDFISIACGSLPHNCIGSIASLENVKSTQAKGRAWIRCVLMEKRLSEYITTAVKQHKLTRKFYLDGSVVLSDEINVLCDTLLGMNAIDFNFCLKGDNVDLSSAMIIDYSPYLLFKQSRESVYSDLEELESLSVQSSWSSSIMSQDTPPDIDWKEKFKFMEQKYKNICEQKGYLEELVRRHERQLGDASREKQAMQESLAHCQSQNKKERRQLESIIIELQNQLLYMQTVHPRPVVQKRTFLNRGTSVVMDDVPTISNQSSPRLQTAKGSDSDQQSYSSSEALSLPASITQRNVAPTSNLAGQLKDDSQSLLALAGSLTSQGSLRLADGTPAKQHILSEPDLVISAQVCADAGSSGHKAETSCSLMSAGVSCPDVTAVDDAGSPSAPSTECFGIDSLTSLCKDTLEIMAEQRMLDRRNENRNSLMQISNNDSSLVESIPSEIIVGNMDGSQYNGKTIMLTSGEISVVENENESDRNLSEIVQTVSSADPSPITMECDTLEQSSDSDKGHFSYRKQASFDSITDNIHEGDKKYVNMQRSISLKDMENKTDFSEVMQRSISHSKGSRVSWVQIETGVGAIQIEEEMLDSSDIDNRNSGEIQNSLNYEESQNLRDVNCDTCNNTESRETQGNAMVKDSVAAETMSSPFLDDVNKSLSSEGEDMQQTASSDSDVKTEVAVVSG